MDPYIDPESLDPNHPLTPRKLENLARADQAHRARASRVEALPCKVTFQTTDVCNLDCPHCQIPRAQKTAAMRPELLDLLRDQLFSTLIELHPTNLGEPFAWPHFHTLCRELAAHGVVLDLTTNGTLLTPARVEWIVPIARDVKVSFDGATAATFERFRRGASFARVCENVRGLVSRLRRVTVRKPIVALQMTLMRDNVDELPALIRLAHDLGADRVKAYHLFSFDLTMDEQSLMGHLDRYEREILPEARDIGAAIGIDLELAEPSGGDPAHLNREVCHLPWHETWIDVDGAVLLCHSHGGEVAGHLERFAEAWNGPLYRRVRAAFAAGAPIGACDGCGMNYSRPTAQSSVPYDSGSFVRLRSDREQVRWSGRMRQFQLRGREAGAGEFDNSSSPAGEGRDRPDRT